jgi:hypothetical protein
MVDLHHRGTDTVPVEQLVADLLEHLGGQRGRTGAEIDDAAHVNPRVMLQRSVTVQVRGPSLPGDLW